MKTIKYSPYKILLKVQNYLKNKGLKNQDKEFILNEEQQLSVNNITGKKVFFDDKGNPTLDIDKAVKSKKGYKWLPFKDGTRIHKFFNDFYHRNYTYQSGIQSYLKFEIEQIPQLDKDGKPILDKDENPVMKTVKKLVTCDADEATIVQTYKVDLTYQDKALYNFEVSSDDLKQFKDDKEKVDSDVSFDDEIELI